ncbi:MAG: DUF134 domain-containing protein [Candidatus Babeliales bacterium]
MVRPLKQRKLFCNPNIVYFKPQGIPLRELEEAVLLMDEFEAIKLYDVDNLSQMEAAKKMGVSQPTFARILDRAYKKIANAIVFGKAIKIEK